MCGIVGIYGGNGYTDLNHAVERMKEVLLHRGPDGDGTYNDSEIPLVLGHRRLAIIDPENAEQPMSSHDGQLTIIFNGAIYNYLELRRELIAKGHPIHSYSDTEVLLYAYREWGDRCVHRLLGMFAFAIWDKKRKRLFCARDRIGIKPFYYFFDGNSLVFASEIKAVLASGLAKREASDSAIQDYLTFQFCLNDKTLFKNIRKLEPGYSLTANFNKSAPSISIQQYWDVQYEIDNSHDEAWFIDNLAILIEDSTRLHLRSDVPLGAHLSGGLDSSTIVCLAAEMLRGEQIKTFTGAFPEGPEFDETDYAKEVSSFARTEYNEVYIDGSNLDSILPKLIYYLDEPVAGPGVIPQYFVSKLAAQNVKVVLGGQGGDELFIGYTRYLVAYLERCLADAIFESTPRDNYAVTLESIIPNMSILQNYVPMLQNLWKGGLFGPQDESYFKIIDRNAVATDLFNRDIFCNDYSPFNAFQSIFNRGDLHSMINKMTHFDLKGSLPALLHVEDRTSMAVSLESRVPLLDHRLVEFMASIPPNIKFKGGRMKHLFKEAVRNTVPKRVMQRTDKMGFPTPITHWTTGVANEFVRDILLSNTTRTRGIYNFKKIESAIENEAEFGRVVWGLLCLELWHRIYIDGDSLPDAA